jgi:hypothetical protein
MTDFVLQVVQTPNVNEAICWEQTEARLQKIYQYSLFLKQPLKLGMFVPCDKDGNFLEEPKKEAYEVGAGVKCGGWDYLYNSEDKAIGYYNKPQFDKDLLKYQKAKEKVLFNGFKSTARFKVSSGFEDMSFLCFNNGNTQVLVTDFTQEEPKTETCYTIEDLIKFKLVLIESAIKQLGL